MNFLFFIALTPSFKETSSKIYSAGKFTGIYVNIYIVDARFTVKLSTL